MTTPTTSPSDQRSTGGASTLICGTPVWKTEAADPASPGRTLTCGKATRSPLFPVSPRLAPPHVARLWHARSPRCELWARRSMGSAGLVSWSPSASDGRLRLYQLLYFAAVERQSGDAV